MNIELGASGRTQTVSSGKTTVLLELLADRFATETLVRLGFGSIPGATLQRLYGGLAVDALPLKVEMAGWQSGWLPRTWEGLGRTGTWTITVPPGETIPDGLTIDQGTGVLSIPRLVERLDLQITYTDASGVTIDTWLVLAGVKTWGTEGLEGAHKELLTRYGHWVAPGDSLPRNVADLRALLEPRGLGSGDVLLETGTELLEFDDGTLITL